jgi:nucleolar protein 12
MDETKLKFAKRKLRVQRCKIGKGMKLSAPKKGPLVKASTEKPGRSVRTKEADVIPKGDPSLGEKLIGLSKEERKQRKSTDPDRLARRLAKKKLRMAMAPNVGKVLRKERVRVRSKAHSA